MMFFLVRGDPSFSVGTWTTPTDELRLFVMCFGNGFPLQRKSLLCRITQPWAWHAQDMVAVKFFKRAQ